MPTSIYKTFRSFLRTNNCEKQFDSNVYQQCGANYFDEYLANYMVLNESFFGRCFDWRKTPEGRDYWKAIDRKWWKEFTRTA